MRPHLTSLPSFARDWAVAVEKERFWGDIMLGKVSSFESCVNGSVVLSILECRRKAILGSFIFWSILTQNKGLMSPFCDKKVAFYLWGNIEPKKKLSDIEVLNQEVLELSTIKLFIVDFSPRFALLVTFVVHFG
jgi:hypothetical protein